MTRSTWTFLLKLQRFQEKNDLCFLIKHGYRQLVKFNPLTFDDPVKKITHTVFLNLFMPQGQVPLHCSRKVPTKMFVVAKAIK